MDSPRRPFAAPVPLIALAALMVSLSSGQQITEFSLKPVTGSPAQRTASLKATGVAGGEHIVEDSPDLFRWHPISPVLAPSGTLDWAHVQVDAAGSGGSADLYRTSTSSWSTRRFYRVRGLATGSPEPAINGTPVPPQGRLTQPVANGAYVIITQGNWSIRMQGTTLAITNPARTDKVEIWGAGSGATGHENLNGKHIKDTLGGPRTLLLPDGTIVTVRFSSAPGSNAIASFSIYDGDQSHRLTTSVDSSGNPNTVVMSSLLRRAGEAEEPDGETGRLLDAPEGVYFENIYNQSNANGQPVPQQSIPLGRTGGPANPNQVNDFYDDPRLGHT